MGFLMLGFMYMKQARNCIREREKSRLGLEAAHKSLEQQHGELEQLSRDLRRASITDPLTGAYNRRFFADRVNKLVSTDEEAARMAAERIRVQVMTHAIEVNGECVGITISSGVSQYRPNEDDIAATIKRADDALYRAKKKRPQPAWSCLTTGSGSCAVLSHHFSDI